MKHILAIFLSLSFLGAKAQEMHNLHAATEHSMMSSAMGKSMNYSLYLPRTMDVSNATKYPVAIIFDRQNTRGCINSVQALDYLMASFAMPEFIVVTIEQQNRFYETSVDLGSQETGGIDKFLGFVLEELDSVLKTSCRANDYRLLIGHSRTAFLTTYALAKHPNKVHAVVANSPFFVEPANDPKIDLVQELARASKTVGEARYYSCSVGGDGKDPHYDFVMTAEERFEKIQFPSGFKVSSAAYENADHYTVVGMHTMDALAGIYSEYGGILSRFLAAEDYSKMDVEWLKIEIKKASEHYGTNWKPGLVHVNSMASHFWQEGEFELALGFLTYGLEFYSKEPDLHGFAGMIYHLLGDDAEAVKQYEAAVECLEFASWYDEDSKVEMRLELEEELKKLVE
jgi:hypothetical protein